MSRRLSTLAAATLFAFSLIPTAPIHAALTAYEFSTTLSLNSIAGPSSADLTFHIQYDPATPGSVSSGNGNTNGVFGNNVSGWVTIDGTEVGTLFSEINLTETLTIDAVTLLFSQEPTTGGGNNATDNVPYFYDINQIRLSWGDNTRKMLATASSLPANFDAFNGKPWSVQFDIYGTNAGSFNSLFGVRVINSPSDQPLNFVSVPVPEPALATAAASLLAATTLTTRRRNRRA